VPNLPTESMFGLKEKRREERRIIIGEENETSR
jgi:hypothetical protein